MFTRGSFNGKDFRPVFEVIYGKLFMQADLFHVLDDGEYCFQVFR